MRFLYISGGSAGHLAPLVAVEKAVKEKYERAESLFVCSDRKSDADYLEGEGVEFKQIPWLKQSFDLPMRYIQNVRQSKRTLNEFKPDAIFCKGSAVSIPLCKEAHKRNIPIVLHESDAVMGKANRVIAKWATAICTGFPMEATGYGLRAIGKYSKLEARSSKLTYTGNPIRPAILQGSKKEGLKITGFSGKKPILLVWGGSQGAQALNEVIVQNMGKLLEICDIIHITGQSKKGAKRQPGYFSMEFAGEELPHLLAVTDVALGRAGSGTISELAALGIPTILVPIEGLANNHQVRNAEIASKEGGALYVHQKDLQKFLVKKVQYILSSKEVLKKMSENMRHIAVPDASLRIAEILFESIARKRSSL